MDHFAVCNIELNHMTMGLFRVLKNTTRIYRAACEFIKDVVEKSGSPSQSAKQLRIC